MSAPGANPSITLTGAHIPATHLPVSAAEAPRPGICISKSALMGLYIAPLFAKRNAYFKHFITPADPVADMVGTLLCMPGCELTSVGFGMGWTEGEIRAVWDEVTQGDKYKGRKKVPWVAPREAKDAAEAGAGAAGGGGSGGGGADQRKAPTAEERLKFAQHITDRSLDLLDKIDAEGKADQEALLYY